MDTLYNMLSGEGCKLDNLLYSEKKSECKTGVNGGQMKLNNVPDNQALFSNMLRHLITTKGSGQTGKSNNGLADLSKNSDSDGQKGTLSQATGAEKVNPFLIDEDKAGKVALGKEAWINSILTGGEEHKATLRVSSNDQKNNNGKSINQIDNSFIGEFVKNMQGKGYNVMMPFQHSGAGQLGDEKIIQALGKMGLDKKQAIDFLSMKSSGKNSVAYGFKESNDIQKTATDILGYMKDKQTDTSLEDGNKQVRGGNEKGQAILSDDLKGDLLKENRNTVDSRSTKEIKNRAESSVSKVHTVDTKEIENRTESSVSKIHTGDTKEIKNRAESFVSKVHAGDKGEFAVEKDSPKRMNPQNISGPRDNIMSANREQHVEKVSVFGGSEQGVNGDADKNGLEGRDPGTQGTKALNRDLRFSEMRQQAMTQAESPSTVMDENKDQFVIRSRNIINQVVSASGKKLGKGFGRIKIELNPPHLGSVDMDILVRDNKVHVILKTEHLDVKQLLQSNTEQLKTALNNQGLVADNITVSVQEKTEVSPFELGHDSALFDENQAKNGKNADGRNWSSSSNQTFAETEEQDVHIESNGEISLFV